MSQGDRLRDALPLLRERFCENANSVNADLAPLVGRANEFLASQGSDGAWPDIRYEPGELKDWHAANHLRRLLAMAQAWYDAISPLHGDTRLLEAIQRGLEHWFRLDLQNPNWWWNQIGAPMLLGEILLRVDPACPRDLVARAVPAFERHRPAARFTGQNLVWVAGVTLRHGILLRDTSLVTLSFTLIQREVRVFPDDEGIQPDMSFHQHGRLLYSGGYGQGFAADTARYLWLAHGTPFEWPAHTAALLTRFLLDGSRWMVRGRTFEYGAIGREITRAGHSAERFFAGCAFMARVPGPRQSEFADLVRNAGKPGVAHAQGNRHFWCSDLMTHHRRTFSISVRLASRRLLNADAPCCGGEGRQCHHGADGATYILRDGDEYRDIFPAWNWRQVPGTTVEQHPMPLSPDTVRGRGEPAFAGGVSDGAFGCAAMAFSRSGLSARKAWFFFDEGMLALGCGIRSRAGVPVVTTLNQCLRRSPVHLAGQDAPVPDGEIRLPPNAAIWHDGIAYHILDGTAVLHLDERTGAWSDCGVGSSEPLSRSVFTLSLDHGSSPLGAAYAYRVLADTPLPLLAAGAGSLPRVIRNDAAIQAVWHEAATLGYAIFYEPGSLTFPDGQGITPDRPCLALYRQAGPTGLQLTLADPVQRGGAIALHLSGRVAGRVAVDLPDHERAGASHTFSWAPADKPRTLP
jgi:chondroitin AC lyase